MCVPHGAYVVHQMEIFTLGMLVVFHIWVKYMPKCYVTGSDLRRSKNGDKLSDTFMRSLDLAFYSRIRKRVFLSRVKKN